MDSPSSPRVGTWKGHWPDQTGATNVDIVLNIAGVTAEGVPCGTVTIGDGPAPPPVIDADAYYPPSLGMGGGAGGLGPIPVMLQPWPGYDYRMLHVQASDTRLAFVITYTELLRPWCQLQPAYPNSLSCLPEYTSSSSGPGPGGESVCRISGPNLTETTVSCVKLQYCTTYTCFCYDGKCDVGLQGEQTQFELHWDGDDLEGSVNQKQLLFLDRVP
jgi:hypothetical protein